MQELRWLWALCLSLWFATAAAAAPTEPDCSNPRSAADSLFVWQQSSNYDPAKAKACLDVPPGKSGEHLAVQLKQVLDARGLYVPVSSLSVDPDFTAEDGAATVTPLDDFPILTLVRGEDELWRYSRDTMQAVPDLYSDTFSPLSVWFQSSLPAVFYTRVLGLHLWQYLYALLLVALAWMVGQVLRLILRGQVRRLVDRAGLKLDDKEYARTNGPIVVLGILSVVVWGLPDLQLSIGLSLGLHKALWIAVWIIGLVALSRFINVGANVAQSWSETTESKLDDQLIPLLRQAAQIVLLVVGGLYVADAIGLDVWKLAAGVGIGGLAFALAAQDTVANVFGSVNIFVDRPFQIGDWVQIGDVEGVVEEVGFRSTRVRTFYNSLVTIPNSKITNANVDNLGLRARRRCKFVIGLTYDTPPDKVQAYAEGVRAILAAHPYVQRSYEVHVYNLGASAIEILVYYHFVVPGWHEELVSRSQNILEFLRLADELDVSFAFPSQSLYLESTPEHRLPEHRPSTVQELSDSAASFGPQGANARPGGPDFPMSWSVQSRGGPMDKGSASDDG